MPDVTIDDKNIPRMKYCGRDCYLWSGVSNTVVPFTYNNISGELIILKEPLINGAPAYRFSKTGGYKA